MKQKVDILIVGGSISGLTAALLLADAGFSVCVCEVKSDYPVLGNMAESGLDNRIFAINHTAARILDNAKVWSIASKTRSTEYTEMELWDKRRAGQCHLSAARLGLDRLGTIIEQKIISAALAERVIAHPDIQWLRGCSPIELKVTEEKVLLRWVDGECEASLIIGADGAESWVRRHANFAMVRSDYTHHALVATLAPEQPHHNTVYQCFDYDGPLAFLPIMDKVSIVWSRSPEKTAHSMQASVSEFEKAVTLYSEHRLGRLSLVGERISFPLAMRHAKQYVQPRVALVADAAHTFHPLAGQGLNVGLQDVGALVEVLKKAREAGQDIGALFVLKSYQRARLGRNWLAITAMKGFEWGFSTSALPVPLLSQWAMWAVDRYTPLQRLMVSVAG